MTTTEMTTPESLGLRRTKKGISLTSSLGSETTDDSSLIMPRGEIKISMKDTLFNESVLLKESIEPKNLILKKITIDINILPRINCLINNLKLEEGKEEQINKFLIDKKKKEWFYYLKFMM